MKSAARSLISAGLLYCTPELPQGVPQYLQEHS